MLDIVLDLDQTRDNAELLNGCAQDDNVLGLMHGKRCIQVADTGVTYKGMVKSFLTSL